MQTYTIALLLPGMLIHYITLNACQMNILNISSLYTRMWSGDTNGAMTILHLQRLMHKNDQFFIKINFFHSNLYFDS